MSELRALIVDADDQLCEFLLKTFSSWEVKAKSITDPLLVTGEIKKIFYNLVLLDIDTSEKSGVNLLAEINELSFDTKVISMTNYACKGYIIKSLEFGAFHFLEKPITLEILNHTVKRALDIQKIELENKQILQDLKNCQDALLSRNSQVEKLNLELADTNKALSILARHIDKIEKHIAREEREEMEKEIAMKIKLFILPIIEKLRKEETLKIYELQLKTLSSHIEELTSYSSANKRLRTVLSSSESKVLTMVRDGMTSDEIAEKLHVSLETVKSHRKNIRRKLNISGTKNDLVTYFQSIEERTAEAEKSRGDGI